MWVRMYPLVVLLIFTNVILKASCKGNGSLTFLIDDTGSMTDDINQVRSSVNKIMDIVFNERSSQIDNMVLVTFNDPDAKVRSVTKDRKTFKYYLDAVYAHNIVNRDCWEPSMNGLLMALKESHRDSYIYVFTDAPAKDYKDSQYVKDLCQKKQSQIVFVLTGHCGSWYDRNRPQAFEVYFDIADACGGLAFDVTKGDVSQVLRTIEETIKGKKAEISRTIVPAGVYKDIPFVIDDHTDYAIVSVSGKDVFLKITGPSASFEYIMWNNNGKVVKIYNITPGTYVATVMGNTRTTVVIVGRTDFFFTHGFSELKPKSLGDTSPQPIEDANVHLSISVTDEQHSVRIVSAQILHTNGDLMKELSLTEISKDFYITNPFVAPSQMFKVAVTGIVKATGKPIKRVAKIATTPQKRPKKLPDNTKPTVSIVEGQNTEVEYNSSVKLTCKVTAYPEPKIMWINSRGVEMPSLSSLREYPYDYISYLEIAYASQGDKYMCYASNNIGKDSTTVNVIVKEPFIGNSVPTGITKVVYGSEGTIPCDISSRFPIDISWYYANTITGATKEITASDKYWISANHNQLKIKKMDLDLVGKYTCIVSLKNKKDVQKEFSTRVKIDGLTAPVVQGPSDVKVLKGKTAVLECKIINGVPAPNITWLFGGRSGSQFTPIAGSTNILRVTNVDDKDAGKYKCVAKNVVDKHEHVMTLFIQHLPKITSNGSTVYQGTEGDTLLRIPCIATGVPKPAITWKLNGRAISASAKYSTEDGTLIIRDPKLSDTNSYTCEAKNEVGSDKVAFKTYIRQAPQVSGAAIKKVRMNTAASIECTVIKGEPKPKITWQYAENSGSKFSPIAGTERVLLISRVENKHAGLYKCVAQNIVGSNGHITTLEVQDLPKIMSNVSTIYLSTEGEAELKIPCVAYGLPKPSITWKLNGLAIISSAKYSIENGMLIIRDPKLSDTNSYTCEAKNEVGLDSAAFKTYIRQVPQVSGVAIKKVRMNTAASVECIVLKGEPKPKITWQYTDGPGSKFSPIAGNDKVLLISRVENKHAGRYKCIAQNTVGSNDHITTLVVQDLPKILSNFSTVYLSTEGEAVLKIPCVAYGLPKPSITWKLNGHDIISSAKYSTENGMLIIRNPKLSDTNSYTCEAKNEVGLDSAVFKTYIRQVPQVSGVAIKKVRMNTAASIECIVVKGEPKPKITWQYTDGPGSKFSPIAGNDKVLLISRVENKHAGRYKCIAQNTVGSNDHITTLVVQDLPKILSNFSTVYLSTEGEAVLKIPCVAYGLPKPSITWKLNGHAIISSAKYSIENGMLIIRDPKLSDTNSYTCEAMNEVGLDSAAFKTYIRQVPLVNGVTSMKVRMGSSVSIECKVVKGEPKPNITWQFMDKSAKYIPIAGTENVLRITTAENKHAGSYKCVAENIVGSNEHITTLIVESLPKFNSNTTTVDGIEGDLALRIPCDVVGVPKPVISWKINNTVIKPGGKYSVEDGALVIANPKKEDSIKTSYTCEAKNYIGSVSAKFEANVEENLTSFGTKHDVYLLRGETRKLECEAYKSKSQSLRWFYNFEEIKGNKEPYLLIERASSGDDGNYTCRVSDKHGHIQTHTYVVDVGNAPVLYARTPVNDWHGDVQDILSNCYYKYKTKPIPDITWSFNGKVLTGRDVANLGIAYKWGTYSCNVSNVHGSVQRSFEVKSSVCLITRNLKDAQYMPIVVTDAGTWPTWGTTEHFIVIPEEEKITLSCSSKKEMSNTFRNFPKQSELKAHCYKQDKFIVNGKVYTLSDLQCRNGLQVSVVRTKVKCSTDTSELIKVGYNVSGFLETYEVCFEHAKNIPLYTRAIITKTDGSLSSAQNWYTYPGIGDKKIKSPFSCKNALSCDCYSKAQLVNAKEFNNGPAKNSTYIEPLNAIPAWRPCNTLKTTWENINDMVRTQMNNYDELIVWSGTHTLQDDNGAVIPRYLWKVLRFDEELVMAIVHVNSPAPTKDDVKCKNICTDDDENWFKVSDKYSYCCSLPDFIKAFNISDGKIGEKLDSAH